VKLRVLLFCSMLVALAFAATAAARSQQMTFPIDDTFTDEGASEACGFDVTVHIEGTARVTLILDAEGNVLREIDTVQGGTVTYSSATGSFSFPLAQPIIFDYGEGAEVGSEVTIKVVGLFGHVPGFIPSDAGLLILTGEVIEFDEFGIPIVDFQDVVVEHGNHESEERIFGAICAALS
jgi:hypothetical protein